MVLGDPNITKKGLLALKDSKPVPITAHSHEIIIPCVYTETVKKIMKAKGIELPLSHSKLAELRKIAKATPGKYTPDPTDHKDEGDSHAKGTKDLKKSTKPKSKVKRIIEILKEKRAVVGKNVAHAKAKTNANVLQNVNKIKISLGGAEKKEGGLMRPPIIPQVAPANQYAMIRPFSYAQHSIPHDLTESLKKSEQDKEREAKELEQRTKMTDALTKRMEEQVQQSIQKIRDQLVSASSWMQKTPEHQEHVHSYFEEKEEEKPASATASSSSPPKEEESEAEESEEEEAHGPGDIIGKLTEEAKTGDLKAYLDERTVPALKEYASKLGLSSHISTGTRKPTIVKMIYNQVMYGRYYSREYVDKHGRKVKEI